MFPWHCLQWSKWHMTSRKSVPLQRQSPYLFISDRKWDIEMTVPGPSWNFDRNLCLHILLLSAHNSITKMPCNLRVKYVYVSAELSRHRRQRKMNSYERQKIKIRALPSFSFIVLLIFVFALSYQYYNHFHLCSFMCWLSLPKSSCHG